MLHSVSVNNKGEAVIFEIGSKPLADMGVLPRKPSDIDWFGPKPLTEVMVKRLFVQSSVHSGGDHKTIYKCVNKQGQTVMLEVEDALATEANKLLYKAMCDSLGTEKYGVYPASLDWLLFFKMSHRYKKNSVHFLKTMQDIILLKSLGAQLPVGSEMLMDMREKQTYTNKLPNLNVSKGEFFDPDTVPYKYDHDSIHVAVALFDKPAYQYYTPNQVLSSWGMFFGCNEHIKLAGVVEESMVLALERSVIPFQIHGVKQINPDRAFSMALEKVCTSITSGWFRAYAYNNYFEAQRMYRVAQQQQCYVKRFQEALTSGIIKPFQA